MSGDSSASIFTLLFPELEVSEDGISVKRNLWKQSFEFYSTDIQLAKKAPEIQVVLISAIQIKG